VAFVTRLVQRFRVDAAGRSPEKEQMKKTAFRAALRQSCSAPL